MEIRAVGMKFRGNHVFSENETLTLERDRHNKFDPNAIKVLADGKHVAFVARENNQAFDPSQVDAVEWKTNWFNGDKIVAATLRVT